MACVTPSKTWNYSKQAANDIHDLPNHGIYRRHSQGKVEQRFSALGQPISELLSHISVLVLLCLRIM